MAVITRDEVKTLLGITGTDKDAKIDLLIPMVEDDIKQITNNPFTDESGNESFPESLKLIAANMISYNLNITRSNIQSETISRYSVTYKSGEGTMGGYPLSVVGGLRKWYRVVFV